MQELFRRKKEHIENQIAMLEKARTDKNRGRIDPEIETQKWRLALLKKYAKMSEAQLRKAQNSFRDKLPSGLWETRKSPPLGLLDDDEKKQIMELAIIEYLLGEYEGVQTE